MGQQVSRYQALIPGAQLVWLPGLNHIPISDDPDRRRPPHAHPPASDHAAGSGRGLTPHGPTFRPGTNLNPSPGGTMSIVTQALPVVPARRAHVVAVLGMGVLVAPSSWALL